MAGYCDPPKEHQFKPGQSGNPAGRPATKPMLDAIKAELEAEGAEVTLSHVAKALLRKAADGEIAAIKELNDRLDGKPAQAVTVAGDPNAPMVTRIERVIVHATNPNGSGI